MELTQEQQQNIAQFEQFRRQLAMITGQRQQVLLQVESAKHALEELEKGKEEKAYRAVGTVIVLLPVDKIKEDLKKEQKGLTDQLETVKAQEKRIQDRLNMLKTKIEASFGAGGAVVGTTKKEAK